MASAPKRFSQRLNFNITRDLRMAVFLFFLTVFVIGMILGAFAPISSNEAEAITSNIQNIQNLPPVARFESIALNDIELTLPMFIPVVGQVFMTIVSYETGVAISAFAVNQSINRATLLQNTFFYPSTLIDCTVFGLAASEGFIFLLSIIKRGYRAESKRFIMTIIGCIAVLLVSEVILVLTVGVIQVPHVPIIPRI